MSAIARYRDAADWAAKNPFLPNGAFGVEDDTGKVKQGDGVKHWNALPYLDVDPYTLPDEDESFTSGVKSYNDLTDKPTVPTTADISATALSVVRASGYAQRRRISASSTTMYANNGSGFGAISGTATDQYARLRQRSAKAGRNAVIEFLTVNGPAELGIGGDGSNITFRAAIEYPAGTFYPAYSRDGNRDITVTPNGGVGRLFVPGFEVPANQDFWVRLRQRGTVGGVLLYTVRPNTSTEWATGPGSVAAADLTVSNTGAPTPGTGLPGYSGAPSLVSFEPYDQTAACVAIIGDSIASGQGEDTSAVSYWTSNPGGYMERALSTDGVTGRSSPGISSVHLGCGAETAANWLGGKGKSRLQILDDIDCRTAWVSFSNDIFSHTLAQTQADSLALYTMLANRGMRVVVFTVTPRSSSTDSWATTAGQTTNGANSTTRVPFNQWLKAGAPINATTKAAVAVGTSGALLVGQPGHPIGQVVDICPAVETATDSGIFKATGSANGYTIDGTHLSPAGYAAVTPILVAQAVPTIV